MIHVVTYANAPHYAAALDEMFRLRHEFYVERNGWSELRRADGRERDEFDTAGSVYLLYLDVEGRLLGSFRLCPSMGPNLLFSKFADWIDDENFAPAADIWDLSRWFLTERARNGPAGCSDRVQAELACGIFEFALSRGLSGYAMFSEARFYQTMLRAGWPVRPLGLPRPYDETGAAAVALFLETDREALAMIRRIKGMTRPVLYEAPAPVRDGDGRSVRDAAEMLEVFYQLNDPATRHALIAAARVPQVRA